MRLSEALDVMALVLCKDWPIRSRVWWGKKLTERTGKNFFVENVSGAGGNVGTVGAAKSPPDGYTFLVTGGNITNNQYLFAEPGYDPLKNFDAVTLAAATPVVLAVNPSVPATTVKELRRHNWLVHCSSMRCSSI